MAAPLLIAGVASGIGGLLNFLSNSSAQERAEALQKEDIQRWLSLQVPDPEQQKVIYQQFVQQGKLAPVLQKAIQAEPSAMEAITTSMRDSVAQNRALQGLQDIGESGGLRLQDKAALQEATLGNQARARAEREGIQARAARMGQAGSGFDVAAQLSGQAADQQQQGRDSLSIAAKAQDRAFDALMKSGELGTQYRNQSFNEQAQKAGAADKINQFNTTNLRDVNAANTGILNRTQEVNLNNAQDIANKNTNLSNEQQRYNKELLQKQYDNQVKRLSGASGGTQNLAKTEQQGGQIAGNAFTNAGNTVSGLAASQANMDQIDKYFEDQEKRRQAQASKGV